MVKGIARHAVVVRSPGMKEFEQAIFIVSGESAEPQVKSPDELLDLAARLAARYQVRTARPKGGGAGIWPCLVSFLAGSVATAAAWWAVATFML